MCFRMLAVLLVLGLISSLFGFNCNVDYFRYNEGMLDITASSVDMIRKPKQVFKDFTNGSGSTMLELVV